MTRGKQPHLILNLAPTGMSPTREQSNKVPLLPEEVVRDVLLAAEKGITVAHLHARDEHGEPTSCKEVYARIIGGIREQNPDIILCVSCSGRKAKSIEQRSEVLELNGDLKPDMASLTLSSLNFAREAITNTPDVVQGLAKRMQDNDIKPELEIFDLGMINILIYLEKQHLLASPFYANILLGNVASAQAEFLEIGTLISKLPKETLWSIGGIGSDQIPVAAIAAAKAPGVRIGLEDNLWLDIERKELASNLELVEKVHQFAEMLGRDIMRPRDLRNQLGLRQWS